MDCAFATLLWTGSRSLQKIAIPREVERLIVTVRLCFESFGSIEHRITKEFDVRAVRTGE
jgi:hypothetical protein